MKSWHRDSMPRLWGRTRLLSGNLPLPQPSWKKISSQHSQAPAPSISARHLVSSHIGSREAKSLINSSRPRPLLQTGSGPCTVSTSLGFLEVGMEVSPQPRTGDKLPKGQLFEGRASEARRGPAPPCCLAPLLRLSDSHPLSIQGCRGNRRLGQAPGAPSPPAAASPPVTVLSPP